MKSQGSGWMWAWAGLTLFWSNQAAAITSGPSVTQMFANFSGASVSIMNLVLGAGFVVGLLVSGVALMRFRAHAENPQQVKLQTPIFLMLIGAALVAMPGSINTATETLALGSSSGTELLSRIPDPQGMPGMGDALMGILLFVKLIGHIAVFRGFMLLKGAAEGRGQGGEMGRAITHILGGAAAININTALAMAAATFAPGMPLPPGLTG